jgi:hypothetical protein
MFEANRALLHTNLEDDLRSVCQPVTTQWIGFLNLSQIALSLRALVHQPINHSTRVIA